MSTSPKPEKGSNVDIDGVEYTVVAAFRHLEDARDVSHTIPNTYWREYNGWGVVLKKAAAETPDYVLR